MSADRTRKIKAGCLVGGWLLCICWTVLPSGCGWLFGGDYVKNISAADPELATEAMNKAAQNKSRRAIVPLVKRLYDEDPAIRLSAIKALERITGRDMGYRSYEPEVKRVAAIERWEAWLVQEGLVKEQDVSAKDS